MPLAFRSIPVLKRVPPWAQFVPAASLPVVIKLVRPFAPFWPAKPLHTKSAEVTSLASSRLFAFASSPTRTLVPPAAHCAPAGSMPVFTSTALPPEPFMPLVPLVPFVPLPPLQAKRLWLTSLASSTLLRLLSNPALIRLPPAGQLLPTGSLSNLTRLMTPGKPAAPGSPGDTSPPLPPQPASASTAPMT